MLYANVVVNITSADLDRTFTYRVPDSMKNTVDIGMQVLVPFGHRNIKGFIIDFSDKADIEDDKIKDILEIISDEIVVETDLIKLAYMISKRCGSSMITALKTVIPVKKQVKEKTVSYYSIAVSKEEAEEYYKKVSDNKRTKAKARAMKVLLENDFVSGDIFEKAANVSAPTIKALIADGIVKKETEQEYRKPIKKVSEEKAIVCLNDAQQKVVRDINANLDRTHLIHGITGSGKTEVYIALIEEQIKRGKQAIFMIPEIALTLQNVSRLYQRFGDRVSIINSKLSQGERYDQYLRAKRGDIDVIVGPRSAVFMPFKNLGLIVIDEEHDNAYKSESMPRYNAKDVAEMRAHLSGATTVLGSATPSVTSYYKAKTGEYMLHELKERAVSGSVLPNVRIVDLREEFKNKNRSMFSRELRSLIEDRLARKEQIMLFLNRRGYAGFISCRSCGFALKCNHCDVSLTSHYGGILKCHYCGSISKMPTVCPKCGSKYIAAFGTGTQKVEYMVAKEFPNAKVLRLDRDSTSKKDSMENILGSFRNGEADILVGTQMIVKGHDFPRVTLVGILAADLSMFSGDYMASERTFQLLTQAAGRAGRGDRPGEVVIQTYNPEHYSIVAASNHDYEGFYEREIAYRAALNYPPKKHMLVVLAESLNEDKCRTFIEKLKGICLEALDGADRDISFIGPSDAHISRGKDLFRKVMYIKSSDEELIILLQSYIREYMKQNGNKDVSVSFDMDPIAGY